MNQLIVQIIGFVGLLFIVVSFQKDRKSFTLISQIIAGLFFTAHFFLLKAWTGAAMNSLGAVRAYVFNIKESKKWLNKKIVMYSFISFFWVVGLLSWQNHLSILPIVSVTLECFALWNKNTKYMRWLFLSARPPWIIYNFFVGSYAGLATEAFIVCSLIIAITRFDILKK
jgi:hypothetical protein